MDFNDDFENIYSDQEVKKITQDLKNQLEEQGKLVMELTNQNEKLNKEKNELKKQLEQSQVIISKHIKEFANSLEKNSKLIEKNILLQSIPECKTMNQALDLVEWRNEEEKDLTIVKLMREIEKLQKPVEQKENMNNKESNNDVIQKEFNDIINGEMKNLQDKLDSLEKQMKEKEFFIEVAFSYLGTLEECQNRKNELINYVQYIISQLQTILSENGIKMQIKFDE